MSKLNLKNIKKSYGSTEVVHALQGVALSFDSCEFVSILGPSGCGKTTLLNIIGGLDRYDDGELLIDGVSTKHYDDTAWDAYRNHSIGFVFQSYNLIGHLNVLQNVELALSFSDISAHEKKQKATTALEKVGLGSYLGKRPNQLSGGQAQRVAIARALVNDPDVILADEPTGALDSETGEQIMKLLKEIAQTKLVIMVTHNAELAEVYSTRIIRLFDGKVQSDSGCAKENPIKAPTTNKKTSSMSPFAAINLSFRNLLTKKNRTILTSLAGGIGIIGVALVLALSSGLSAFMGGMQSDALAGYPLTITTVEESVPTDEAPNRERSHEFRTPVTSIKGYAEFFREDAEGKRELNSQQKVDYSNIIIGESERLITLSRDLLHLSEIESKAIQEKTTFSLDEQIRKVVVLLEPLWSKKNIEFSMDLTEVEYTGSKDLLNQVWINLIHNAIKFSYDEGLVTITAKNEGDMVVIGVIDQGIGIPPEMEEKIFDAFYKASKSRAGEGNGLGLAIVKQILKLIDGSITVESSPGKGTAFYVSLPPNCS